MRRFAETRPGVTFSMWIEVTTPHVLVIKVTWKQPPTEQMLVCTAESMQEDVTKIANRVLLAREPGRTVWQWLTTKDPYA